MSDIDYQELDTFTVRLRKLIPVPADWIGAMVFVLKRLEGLAMTADKDHPQSYELFLQRLQDVIADRLSNHRW